MTEFVGGVEARALCGLGGVQLAANASLSGPTVAKMARRYLGQLKVGDLARATQPDDLPEVRHCGSNAPTGPRQTGLG
ncbi:hypothetical protein AB0J20_26710 [Micromonospora costi]|uniref:hypothetical protein n=1 Tax=Micromonospora costi TaxID=1530042 RepID=UPI0033E9F78E